MLPRQFSELELSVSENTADFLAGTFLREIDLFAMFACLAQHLVLSVSKNFTFCLTSEYCDGFMHFCLLIHTFLLNITTTLAISLQLTLK